MSYLGRIAEPEKMISILCARLAPTDLSNWVARFDPIRLGLQTRSNFSQVRSKQILKPGELLQSLSLPSIGSHCALLKREPMEREMKDKQGCQLEFVARSTGELTIPIRAR